MKYRNRLVSWVIIIFVSFSLLTLIIAISNHHKDKEAVLKSRMDCYADVVVNSPSLEYAEKVLPEDIRITVLSHQGVVIGDSWLAESEIGMRSERPEIKECIRRGVSYLIRDSESLGGKYVYFAKKYDYVIVRISQHYGEKQMKFMMPDWSLVASIGLLLLISVLAIFYLSNIYKKKELVKKEKETRHIKYELTSNISHELKTPVTSLQAYLETIVSHPDMDEERRQLFEERAYVQSLKLSDIITDITIVTKLEESPGQYKVCPVNIKVLFDEIIEELSGDLTKHEIKVENGLEPVCIRTNGNLMYSIFRNLLENTIKYGGDGCSVSVSSMLRKDGLYELDYHDTGRGFPDDQMDKIFDRFFRLDSDRATGKGGCGLGLSIIRNAVIAHKGTISAYHVKGGGLGFRFTLSDLQ